MGREYVTYLFFPFFPLVPFRGKATECLGEDLRLKFREGDCD